jgi:GTP cyclohydrolase II
MGLPVVLTDGPDAALAISVEALSTARLADMRALGSLSLALTARRAETLKARVYDEDIARIEVPASEGLQWIQALADPADYLNSPMKGPLSSLRGGSADLHRLAIALVKSARLLPAAASGSAPQCR